jgi:membrane protein DedA with SNARE-associated domain
MALESMIAPIPSEAVMPFAGFLATDIEGSVMTMPLIVVWSTSGSLIGSMLSYWMGLYGGRPLVMKIGRYLLLNVHHLEQTEKYFYKYGAITVFICRFVPVVRHFISIPAGMARMNIPRFLIYTGVGAGCWNLILAWLGFKLKENWTAIKPYFHYVDLAIVAGALIVIIWFFRTQFKLRMNNANAKLIETDKEN